MHRLRTDDGVELPAVPRPSMRGIVLGALAIAVVAGCSGDSSAKPEEIKAPKPAGAPGRPGATVPDN